MLQWSDKLHVLFKLTRKTPEQCHTIQPCLKFDLKCTFPECILVGVYWPCSSWSMMRNSTSTLVKMTTRNNSEINICLTTPSMNGYNEKMYNALRAGCPTSSLTRWRSFIMRSPAGVNPKMKAYFAKKKSFFTWQKSNLLTKLVWCKEPRKFKVVIWRGRSIRDFSNHVFNIYKVDCIVIWAELVDNPLIYTQSRFIDIPKRMSGKI